MRRESPPLTSRPKHACRLPILQRVRKTKLLAKSRILRDKLYLCTALHGEGVSG